MTLVDVALPLEDHQDRARPRMVDREQLTELGVAAVSALALVWVPFHLAGWNAPFGGLVCWYGAFATIYGIVVRQRHGVIELKDRLATLVVWSGAIVAVTPLVFLVYFVLVRGLPVVFTGFPAFPFLRQDLRHFSPTDPVSKAGMRAGLIGSLEQVLVAAVITIPVGILAATFLNEIGGRFASVIRTIADAMTGLPTIIAGLLIYSAYVQPRGTKGFSGLAAAAALAVVMLPTIVRTAEEVLRIVAGNLREAALALGAPEWRTVMRVVIPTARTGLVTAAILGVARAIGETAPVLITAFGAPRTNNNLLRNPQDDLPLRIYQLVRSPSNSNVAVAWGGAFILLVMILTLFVLARILGTGGGSQRRLRGSLTRLASRPTSPNPPRPAS